MQEDPGSTRDSKHSFSVLDRLLITHPVWLQLSINSDSALYILLREPVGTFLVRKCSSTQRKILCVRVSGDRTTFAVKECYICEEDSTFALECSALSFPDLCRLVAFYCISRDVLPFPLQLPEAIAQAASHRKLEAISHMGLEFWSTLNPSELQNGPGDLLSPPSTWTSAWTSASTRTSMSTRASQDQIGPPQDMCAMVARGRQGALCFINPLFLQLELTHQAAQGASNKRHRFKRSMRVRVSTESSLNLSGGPRPCSPPPPEPSAGGGRMLPSPSPQRKVHAGAGLLKRAPALAPTSMEDEELVPHPPPLSLPDLQETPQPLEDEPSVVVACLALEGCPAPSLAELDSSSSFSSLEDESEPEEEEQEEEEPDDRPLTRTNSKQRPPLVRSHGHGGLHRMSAAFVCFFAPEKRLARLVEELSRDRRSTFGAMVLDFLQRQREELKTLLMSYPASMSSFSFSASTCSSMSSSPLTSVGLLQGVRRFLSQAKAFLLDSGELEPPIDTLVPENEKDLALEKAMFGCVLKPLKAQLSRGLALLHRLDGSTQRLTTTLHRDQEGALERLGVQVGVPDARGVERVRQKLALMQRTHSPIDKVLLLLQVCKCVHKAMGSLHGQEVSPVDFLPALSYLIVQCNRPQLLLEVEYMMELLEPSWLTGEGGYYLTSVYASLCLIQTPELEDLPPGSLPQEAQDQLREWGYRRSCEAQSQHRQLQSQRCVRVLFQDGERSAVRTLQWRAGESREVLAQLCAATFGVSDPQHYTLYWRSGGEMRALPTQAQPQDLASHSEGGPSLSYLRTDHDFSKMRRLTRGGAVDLGESVCEE